MSEVNDSMSDDLVCTSRVILSILLFVITMAAILLVSSHGAGSKKAPTSDANLETAINLSKVDPRLSAMYNSQLEDGVITDNEYASLDELADSIIEEQKIKIIKLRNEIAKFQDNARNNREPKTR